VRDRSLRPGAIGNRASGLSGRQLSCLQPRIVTAAMPRKQPVGKLVGSSQKLRSRRKVNWLAAAKAAGRPPAIVRSATLEPQPPRGAAASDLRLVVVATWYTLGSV
jgi:hypothetical protein